MVNVLFHVRAYVDDQTVGGRTIIRHTIFQERSDDLIGLCCYIKGLRIFALVGDSGSISH